MKIKSTVRLLPEGISYDSMDSPVGELVIVASSQALHAILWDVILEHPVAAGAVRQLKKTESTNVITKTKKQLMEYFAGKRKIFDLPLSPQGTAFQLQAWQQLRAIPYGHTISYGEQAQRLGNKNKSRAVGMANGCNPISIIIPCHRVIGSNGKLVGFAGGLDKKAYLLDLEKANS